MALCQPHGSVGARGGLAHWHHGQRCQAQEAGDRAESRLPLHNHRPLPAAGQEIHVLMGLAAPTELGEAPGTWRGGCLTTSARCESQRPSNLRLHCGRRAEGPQGGGLGWGQQRCWETRQEPLLGAGAGRTDNGTKAGQECWAGTRSPGRWARLGVEWPLWAASVS